MKKQALTVITTSFPASGDGSEAAGSFVADLVDEISKYIAVHVIAPGPVKTIEQWSSSVNIFRYAAPKRPLSTLKPWKPNDLTWLIRVLLGGLQATRLGAKGSAHIFALWALPSGEWARRVSKENGIAFSVWMLGSDIWTLGRIPLVRSALASVIQQSSSAYADGYQLAEDAKVISGRNIDFLPSTRAIQTRMTSVPRTQAPYRLLFLGRWHFNKGIDLLLEALDLLGDDDWAKIECIEIQGGGPMEDLVADRVSKLKKAGYPVLLGGFLTKPNAEQAIERADWVLIPSRIESIPVIFSDAMKLGRPVLTMPVGDLSFLIEEAQCGLLAKSVTAHAFAEVIRQALTTSTDHFTQGISVQAERFNLEKLAKEIVKKMVPDE